MTTQKKNLIQIILVAMLLFITHMITQPTISTAAQEEQWQKYIDEDYKFTVEYPTQNWQVQTMWHVFDAEPQAITKRVSFFAQRVELIIDIWRQPQEDITGWVRYINHRVQPDLEIAINGTVSGFPAIVYIDENEQAPNVLTTAFSDGNAFYLIQYVIGDGGLSMDTYLHLLDSFQSLAANSSEIPDDFYFPPELQEKATQISEYIESDTCCGISDSGNPFPCDNGNCTWWVYYIKGYVPFTGSAWEWGHKVNQGLYPGWYLAENPAVGSIAWWDKNTCWTDVGHVAYVSSKSGYNAWIRVSEMTWQGTPCSEEPRYRKIDLPSCDEPLGYIRQ